MAKALSQASMVSDDNHSKRRKEYNLHEHDIMAITSTTR